MISYQGYPAIFLYGHDNISMNAYMGFYGFNRIISVLMWHTRAMNGPYTVVFYEFGDDGSVATMQSELTIRGNLMG